MVRKISGKHTKSSSTHLQKADGTEATDRKDIANTLAEGFEKNSSSQNYSAKFQRFKAVKERQQHNFSSENNEQYNELFTIRELMILLLVLMRSIISF